MSRITVSCHIERQNLVGVLVLMHLLLILALVTATRAEAAYPDDQTPKVSYVGQVEPIFRANCQGCHQPAKPFGDYVMTDFAGLISRGESGEPAIVPGHPEGSYLLDQIRPIEGQAAMPKKAAPLTDAEIDLIRRWIAEGAINDSPPSSPKYSQDNPPVYSRPPVVTSLAFSPDGKWLASTGFQEVLLIDTASWETRYRLIGLSERIESLSFSPDSKRLAVTGGSPGKIGEVQVWQVSDGTLLLSKQVTFDTVYGGCFSPDGSLIAFGGADNVVRAIDSTTGEQKLHQGAHEDWVRSCVFNPDGSHLLSAGRDMTVKLTEVKTERFVDNVTSITPGALRGGINALAMHPERNEVLVGGADGVPKVFRIFRETERRIGDDANLIRQFPSTAGRIFDIAVSADGANLALVSTLDGSSQLHIYPYDFKGELSDELKAILKKRVADRKAEEKKKVAEYRRKTSPVSVDLTFDTTSLYAVAFSADGNQVAAAGSDGLVRIVALDSKQVVHEFSPVAIDDRDANASVEDVLASTHGLSPGANAVPDADSERSLLPNVSLVGLQVFPESIQIGSRLEYAQLVVTAQYQDGSTADVTRQVRLDAAPEVVTVAPDGLIRPVGSGTAKIEVTYDQLSAQIPVEVSLVEMGQVDFIRDVNPVLSRLGCNSGTCHGAQKGKNGFKLSLRGYDPVEDLRALSDDLGSRRLNTAAPDASLMLLKPLGTVPHEGGVLLTRDSVYYQTLRNWIAGGAKLDTASEKVARIEIYPTKPVIQSIGAWQQFSVIAHFPDGTTRDVTHEAFVESGDTEICESFEGSRVRAVRRGEAPVLVRYEGAYAAATVTVMGDRSGFAWQEPEAYNTIDKLVANKWARMKIHPSPLTEDHEFLRRLRLDLTGLPPSVQELQQFVADPRPSELKRADKIDELLGSEDYIEHWTNKWADLFQVNSKFLGREGATAFRGWIRERIAKNQPYDEFAREVLTASGSNRENPAASYYKILRDPDLIMENTTHLFLAVRFNCNKCHDHPFERWTQDQYYELASYFAQTGLKRDPKSGEKKIGGTAVEGAKPLYEEVFDRPDGEMTHERTGKQVAPSFPFDCEYEVSENATRRQELAAWITSPDNPYFAKSYVNRLWGYLTGTGLMEPLDDIRAGNPPTNPELMEHLTREFIENGFDTRHILRMICNSRTYQLSVTSNRWNVDDRLNYSHAKARRLPAEVLYDSIYRVTGAVSEIPGVQPGTRAAALPDVAVQLPDGFLNNFGRPVRESACECERSDGLQLGPVMALVSGATVGKAISDPKCALPALVQEGVDEEAMVQEIFLRVLNREASADEIAEVLKSADQIELDHVALAKQLSQAEAEWVKRKSQLESKRIGALEKVKMQIAERTEAIAEDRKKMEMDRLAKLAEAEAALKKYDDTLLPVANDYLKKQKHRNWFPLIPTKLAATNKDTLTTQPDRSIVATGKGDKGAYQLTYRTSLRDLSGFRLETLPQPGIPGGGPGLPQNGNFVVTEIEVMAWQVGDPKTKKKLKIASGKADFSQDGFSPNQVFDGNARDQRGWAVHPRGGIVHWATFAFAEKLDFGADTMLQFVIHQNHNAAQHRLAHFRISVSNDGSPSELGLPEAFATIQAQDEKSRSRETSKDLIAYLAKTDKQYLELASQVAAAKRPLPADEKLVALENQKKKLEVPTPDPAALVQLRSDVAASQNQVENRQLTLAQDLTWALINSPAFLFNH